jgi:hypothetical protein
MIGFIRYTTAKKCKTPTLYLIIHEMVDETLHVSIFTTARMPGNEPWDGYRQRLTLEQTPQFKPPTGHVALLPNYVS